MLTAVVFAGAARAAELVTAELDGTHNTVTVVRGGSSSFTISLEANGNAQCGSTHDVRVHTVFSVGSGASSSTLSTDRRFSAPGSGQNCAITWAGAPSPLTVSATVSATASATLGNHTIAIVTQIVSSNTTGGKLEDKTATTLTFQVVAPANAAPVIATKAPNASGSEGSTLSTNGSFSDTDALTVAKTAGAGTVTDLGGGAWSWSLATTDQSSGSVTIEATDTANQKVSDTFTWAAVNVPPAVSSAPANAAGVEGGTLSTSGAFTDVVADPITITKHAGAGTVVDNGNGTWSWSLTAADQTSGSVTVRANDGDGGLTDVSFTYVASNVAPAIVIAPADAAGVEGGTLITSGQFSDVAADPVAVTKHAGAGTVTDNGDGTWSWSLDAADQTSGSVTVRANDGDGGLTDATFTYAASNVAPAVVVSPADAQGVEGTTLRTGGEFSDVAADTIAVTKHSGAGTVVDNGDGTWSWSLDAGDETSGTVVVRAADEDGGHTDASFGYVALNVKPGVRTKALDAAGDEGSLLTTGGAFSDVAADTITITKQSGDGTVTDNGDGTWSWSLATTDDAAGTVVVQATDPAGESETDTFSFLAANLDPVVAIAPADAAGVEGETLATNGAFSDVAADTITITKHSGAGTVTDNGDGTWSWSLPTTDDAAGTVVVRATDDDGGSAQVSFDYLAVNLDPAVVSAPADASGDEGGTLITSGQFSDVSGDTLSVTKHSGAGTVTDNGDGTWSWSLPTTDDAAGTVVVRATDDDGGSAQVSFDYLARNVAPGVPVHPSDAAGVEGGTLSTSGAFGDVAADAMTVTRVSGAGTVVDNGDGTWSWSLPTTDDAAGTVVVRATDDDGGDTEVAFEYLAENVAPAIGTLALTGAGGIACLTGNAVNLSFSYSDPAGANDTHAGSINWGDGTAPESFSSSPVSVAHTYAAGGPYTIRVNVSDEDGGAAVEKTTLASFHYQLSALLAPFNSDGSSVFKHGSTVPVKVRITDCRGTAVAGLAPTVGTSTVSSVAPSDPVNEATSTTSSDTGSTMRWDATNQHYIYNFATKSLSDANATYHMYVREAATVQKQSGQRFGIKSK